MRRLYVVRHGETDWNREGRLQGWRDIPINDTGRAQAARNGRALAAVLAKPADLDFVSSPLERARETMEIVRRTLGLEAAGYRVDDRFKELGFGRWEGWTLADLRLRDPAGFKAHRDRRWHAVPPGGESYAMLATRVEQALETLQRDTVLVAHGGVVRAIRVLLCGADPRDVATLPTPQDRVMVIEGERLSWL